MARMSIDDMVARDTRIDRLAKLCAWSRRETRACLEDIWALCYDRVAPYLSAEDIEITAARDAVSPSAHASGFVDAMMSVGLARQAVRADRYCTRKDGSLVPWPDDEWRNRIYISGASERIGYQLNKSLVGHAAGIKSGEARRKRREPTFNERSTEGEGGTNPSSSASASASSIQEPAAPPPLVLSVLKAKVDKATSGHQAVIAEFTTRYRAAYGADPSWPKWTGQVKALLKSHSPDEIRRRIEILFTSPPTWLQGPYDFGTLVQHFDKLVQPTKQTSNGRPPEPPRTNLPLL